MAMLSIDSLGLDGSVYIAADASISFTPHESCIQISVSPRFFNF